MSNPATRKVWIKFNLVDPPIPYNHSLIPSPGDRYLVANVTVTNKQPMQIPFAPGAFALIMPNSTAYYANYAVCNSNCTMNVLENRTLNGSFSSDLYVLFSVPAGTGALKLVYTASDPPIVMSST